MENSLASLAFLGRAAKAISLGHHQDIFAALINVQLDQIARINRDRQRIAAAYTKALVPFRDAIALPIAPKGMTNPNWHIYALKFPTHALQQQFMRKMREKHIEVSSHYVPLHQSPMGRSLMGRTYRLPVTEDVAGTLVRMPIYAGMTEKELEYVITVAGKVLKTL